MLFQQSWEAIFVLIYLKYYPSLRNIFEALYPSKNEIREKIPFVKNLSNKRVHKSIQGTKIEFNGYRICNHYVKIIVTG